MKKIKDNLSDKWLSLRYSNATMPKFTRYGFKLGLGLGIFVFGILLILRFSGNLLNPSDYESISSTPNSVLNKLDNEKSKKDQFTLILYSSECEACKDVEKDLVTEVEKIKDDNQIQKQIIATDLAKMNPAELDQIRQKIPDILVEEDQIPTPLVANVYFNDEEQLKVSEQSNTAHMDSIKKVLYKNN